MPENNSRIFVPELLMISGLGQNVGKTTLACRIIAHFQQYSKIVALKVSPHFHQNTGMALSIQKHKSWQLFEETTLTRGKDTVRMLQAGAISSFFLQAESNDLLEGYYAFRQLAPKNSLIVCESAALYAFIRPSVFLALRQINCKIGSIEDEKIFQAADRIITFTLNGFDFNLSELEIINNRWHLTDHVNDDTSGSAQ